MQMIFQVTIWDEVINKQSLFPRNAISNQWNKVFVMDTTNDLNFRPKLTLSLFTVQFQLFNCNHFLIWKDPFMDMTKTTLTNKLFSEKPLVAMANSSYENIPWERPMG